MNKKFELLREAVNTYKVNHCDGDKNEKELLEFIDELEQLTIPVVVGQSEQLVCDDHNLKEVDSIGDKVFKMCDNCGETEAN
jgi:hypothetical protein